MSPLSFILIIASILFLFFAIDGLQRRKLDFIHFSIFVGGVVVILLSLFYPGFQTEFARIFGVARISDIIVYAGLIILGYFYFEMLNELTKHKSQMTKLISALAEKESNLEHCMSAHSHPHDEKSTFCFLIRAYNEEKAIGAVIDQIFTHGFSHIVVVNDASTDGTLDCIAGKQKQYPDRTLIVLSHAINRWGGAANKTGFKFLGTHAAALHIERVVTYDADGQMDIDDMQTFQHEMKTHPHVKAFLGSRFITGGEAENIPSSRKLILRGSKVVTRIFNRLRVTDPHNGYRVLHRDVVANIRLTSDGMLYASELLDCIRKNHVPFLEVPVHIIYTDYSLEKWQKNSNAIKILIEMIYKKLFYK